MKINKILVTFEVQEKIFKKHNVKREEIEAVFFDEPYYFHTKKKRYHRNPTTLEYRPEFARNFVTRVGFLGYQKKITPFYPPHYRTELSFSLYIAIGFIEKYVTVVFYYDNGDAVIVTAYKSSRWQKKLYKVKKW